MGSALFLSARGEDLEVNTAPVEKLVRVPGIGIRGANRIRAARRYTKLTLEDLKRMRIVLKRAIYFITVNGKFYGLERPDLIRGNLLAADLRENAEQLTLFSAPEINASVLTGEL